MDRQFLKVKPLNEGFEALIRVSDIEYIEELMSKCFLKANGKTYVIEKTMEQLIELLQLEVIEG